jgi:hypothetical protein
VYQGTCLMHWNALSRAGVHSSVFLPPLKAVVSGSRTAAMVLRQNVASHNVYVT